jgi:hypothetical protein
VKEIALEVGIRTDKAWHLEREIPEEVAARTDRENEFPNEMWKKFGEAG